MYKLFIIGSVGYFFAYLFDISILYGKELLKRVFFLGFFLTAVPYPFLFATLETPHSLAVRGILILILGALSCLLVFSVFLEPALFSGRGGSSLYKGGTYRISRHPGFLWYTGINCVIALYFLRWDVLTLVIGLTIDNFLLILHEDRKLFPLMFEGYEEYKKDTPFLCSVKKRGGSR